MAKNSHIFPKNGPNDLKFSHMMYFWCFYKIPTFWTFSPFFGRFLAKTPIFFRWFGKQIKTKLLTESLCNFSVFAKIGQFFVYMFLDMFRTNGLLQLFSIFHFCDFIGLENCWGGSFWGKIDNFHQFCSILHPFAIFEAYKMIKMKNREKL